MICQSDLRTCLGAMFNKLRSGNESGWVITQDMESAAYALYSANEDDIPWDDIWAGNQRPMLFMSRLELMVLLSEPVMGIFKEMQNANASPSVPTGK